jgi:hypothetical protein
MKQHDEFYVSYLPKAPERLGRMIVRTVAMAAIIAAALALLLVAGQHPFAASTFEYGILREHPYPRVDLGSGKTVLLVGAGKHGVADVVAEMDGMPVRLEGSRIYRGDQMMVELFQDSLTPTGPRVVEGAQRVSAGMAVTLTGEIADSKCYLGVMNPGNGKVHRDCAARCIRGGIPPALIAKDERGETRLLLLTSVDGRPLKRTLLEYVGEPVRITGAVVQFGTGLQFRINPAQIQRLQE